MSAPDWEGLRALYEEGGSDYEAARFLRVTIRRFHQLQEESPAFADFVEMGNTLSAAWWYETGRKAMFRDKFQSGLFSFQMKNRLGWADKVETNDTTDKEPVNLEQAKGQLAAAMQRIATSHPELLDGAKLLPDNRNADDR